MLGGHDIAKMAAEAVTNKLRQFNIKDEEEEEKERFDEADHKYSVTGQHYDKYTAAKQLVKDSKQQLDGAISYLDDRILVRIRENEKECQGQVMKYLRTKEWELKSVLKRLDIKNDNSDCKDALIGKLHTLVNKIEADGRELLIRLRMNEDEMHQMKDQMDDDSHDKKFLIEKVRKEKQSSRK